MAESSPQDLSLRGTRLFSWLDGVSYIALLGVAMPLKYIWDRPMAVTIVGGLHGFFFVGLCVFLLAAFVRGKLSFLWCVAIFFGALFPFVPFFLEHRLKRM